MMNEPIGEGPKKNMESGQDQPTKPTGLKDRFGELQKKMFGENPFGGDNPYTEVSTGERPSIWGEPEDGQKNRQPIGADQQQHQSKNPIVRTRTELPIGAETNAQQQYADLQRKNAPKNDYYLMSIEGAANKNSFKYFDEAGESIALEGFPFDKKSALSLVKSKHATKDFTTGLIRIPFKAKDTSNGPEETFLAQIKTNGVTTISKTPIENLGISEVLTLDQLIQKSTQQLQ